MIRLMVLLCAGLFLAMPGRMPCLRDAQPRRKRIVPRHHAVNQTRRLRPRRVLLQFSVIGKSLLTQHL